MSSGENVFEKGLVSVVTPVYNNEAFLSEMLESVLSQTYNKIQMILVDDGSTDSTPDIAKAYAEKFAGRGYEYTFVSIAHKNASSAVSKGLSYVKGEFLIWPDSDDLLLPESVEKRVAFLENNAQYGAVRSLPDYFDAETGATAAPRETITESADDHIFWDIIEGRSFVSCGCYMLRSELFFGIYTEKKIPVYDVGQNFQMLLPYMYFYTCGTISQVLYRVRVHSGSHSVRRLTLKDEIKVINGFSALLDEIAEICKITDSDELYRIKQWEKRRKKALARRTIRRLPIIKQMIKFKHSLRK